MNKKKVSKLSKQEEYDLICYLLDKGFTQMNITKLFNGKYAQSRISQIKKSREEAQHE